MRLLLVEDAQRLRRFILTALKRSGYVVDATGDGEEAFWLATSTEYDVIVLDVMLPKMDGLTLLRRFRAEGRMTHVLLLTARDTVDDRVVGLRAGADDYLVKPFALEELLARVEALCRRSYGQKSRADSGHSGLGLSVVSAAANSLGLTVVPHLEPPGRLIITIDGLEKATPTPSTSEPRN